MIRNAALPMFLGFRGQLRRLPAYFLAGRGIGVTPTCSSAVYGVP